MDLETPLASHEFLELHHAMSHADPSLEITLPILDLTGRAAPLDWLEVFGNDRPVELEVGSGKGLFLVNAATARPDHNFLGIELAKKYAYKSAERIAKLSLTNVRVYPGDGCQLLAEFVPEGSLAAVHVYFPDPWWKRRHKKRRVFTESFVASVQRGLRTGGELQLATDVEEYFTVMRHLVSQFDQFVEQPLPEPQEPTHGFDYLTNFERKYRIEGRPIHRAWYRKRGDV